MVSYGYKNLIFLIVLINFNALFPAGSVNNKSLINRLYSSLAGSKPILLFDNKIMTKIYTLTFQSFYGNEPASPEYQKLGEEAQLLVGIPKEYHVPIMKFSSKMAAKFSGGALTVPGAIYVNEDQLDNASYGVKRFVLFHEAIHRKYNDASFGFIQGLVGAIIISEVSYQLFLYSEAKISKDSFIYRLWPLGYAGLLLSSFALSCLISNWFSKYVESRADSEGSYASKCSICVKQEANSRYFVFDILNDPSKTKGYLGADALEKISKDLKSENKLCRYHSGSH